MGTYNMPEKTVGQCYFCKKNVSNEEGLVVIDTPDGRALSHPYHTGVVDIAVETMLEGIKEKVSALSANPVTSVEEHNAHD